MSKEDEILNELRKSYRELFTGLSSFMIAYGLDTKSVLEAMIDDSMSFEDIKKDTPSEKMKTIRERLGL